ncbi:MAG: NUDIX domain-containing protein [Candidatus Methanomethylophilaceae archaeon]
MELTDVYDSEKRRTGRVVPRYQWGPDGFRLTVHICIFDGDKMLIQKRSMDKRIHPGLWDLSSAGQVDAGEDSHEGAMREIHEELGLPYTVSERDLCVTVRMPHTFDDTYILEYDGSPIVMQGSEVDATEWATEDRIVSMIGDGSFIAYRPGFIRMLFDAHRNGRRNLPEISLDECVLPAWKNGYA